MGKVISIINMKGGVGKTTLSIGIADYLSNIKKNILLIDADPQFNATQALLDAYKSQNKDSENENFYNRVVLPKKKTIHRLFRIQEDMYSSLTMPTDNDLIIELKQNLSILCGDLSLVLVNRSSDHTFVTRLRNFIEDNDIKQKYDYIIIDCPPTLTIYTDSALMASDYYLIPNIIDRYSIIGIDSLQKAVNNLIREERITTLKCIGLVYTMVSNSSKEEDLRISFENKDVVSNLEIFTSRLSKTKNIQVGVSGSLPTKYRRSREDIEAISLELLERIESNEG